jgi:hypothetical protein
VCTGGYTDLQETQKQLYMTKTTYGDGAHPKMTEYGINYGADDNVRVDVTEVAAKVGFCFSLFFGFWGAFVARFARVLYSLSQSVPLDFPTNISC